MHLRLGNLTPEQFAERVGSEFTEQEAAYLRSVASGNANLAGPDDFHIFERPSISVTVGSPTTHVLDVFKAANARKPFNREVSFDLDNRWATPTEPEEKP